jgi:hypothetical protein
LPIPRRLAHVLPALSTALFLSVLSSAPRAETVIGQVVDTMGLPVAGIDLDFINQRGGGVPIVFNDGTDAGGFFTTTVPPGLFDIVFTPASGTTNLSITIQDVGVVGTVDLGVITLPEGALLECRVLSHQGLPLASVAYEILAEADDALLAEGLTDLFGHFVATVPFGPAELRLDPELALGVTQAPRVLELPLGMSTRLGDVILEQGFTISATLLLPSGLPAVTVDSDTRDAATGDVVWTPGDNSDATGTYAIIVPIGVYDFVVCPKATTGLLAQEFTGVDITGDFFGGTHVLIPGVSVTGTVTDVLGQPLQNIDVDLVFPGTGAEVPLCGDNTNAAGQYSIIAPAGVYDLAFTPPHDLFFGSAFQAGVAVINPVTANSVLPDCPPPAAYGTGFPGFGGVVPDLTTSGGSSRIGNDEFTLEITGARGSVDAYLLVGAAPASIPLPFGTLLVAGPPIPVPGQTSSLMDVSMTNGPGGPPVGPPVQILALRMRGPILVPGAGQLMLPFPIPDDPSWAGVTRYAQVLVRDFGAMGGWSLTHGIQITFCE